MVNDKTNINFHRSNGNVVLEKNAKSIVHRKENQFRNSKYSKQYKKGYEQHQEKTSRISRPCDEKGKAIAFVDNRKDRRKKKQRSSKNTTTRRHSSLAGRKHCGDVCGCKGSQKAEGHDRLRLQQTRQLMMMTWSTVDLPRRRPACSRGSCGSTTGSTQLCINLSRIFNRTQNSEMGLYDLGTV